MRLPEASSNDKLSANLKKLAGYYSDIEIGGNKDLNIIFAALKLCLELQQFLNEHSSEFAEKILLPNVLRPLSDGGEKIMAVKLVTLLQDVRMKFHSSIITPLRQELNTLKHPKSDTQISDIYSNIVIMSRQIEKLTNAFTKDQLAQIQQILNQTKDIVQSAKSIMAKPQLDAKKSGRFTVWKKGFIYHDPAMREADDKMQISHRASHDKKLPFEHTDTHEDTVVKKPKPGK